MQVLLACLKVNITTRENDAHLERGLELQLDGVENAPEVFGRVETEGNSDHPL